MRIIADAGSTKIHWAIVQADREIRIVTTSGLNPLLITAEEFQQRVASELGPHLKGMIPDRIDYYGAGCVPHVCRATEDAIRRATGSVTVNVASDMLGAARSLCGTSPGIACILGTGSNSCLYDGQNISDSVGALGYVLGDEGSGAVIGRRFLGDMFKRQLPREVTADFLESTGLTQADVIDRVYRQPQPNRFLASMMPMVKKHIENGAVEAMVVDEFKRFLMRNVEPYTDARSLKINFTGSVAVHFQPQLEKALAERDLKRGHICGDPINGLIEYHLKCLS